MGVGVADLGAPLQRGDFIEVTWADILEDPVGDPEKAELAIRKTLAIYWDERVSEGVPSLVTTTTLDADGSHQQGFCIYPRACVLKVELIKRKKGGRKRGNARRNSRGSQEGDPLAGAGTPSPGGGGSAPPTPGAGGD